MAAALAASACAGQADAPGAPDDAGAVADAGPAPDEAADGDAAEPDAADPEAADPDAEAAAQELPDPAEVGANELGQIPVLMYHRLLPDGGGDYDLTPEEFRDELQWLYDHDYRPVRMADVAAGTIDLPPGASPVVLTFDDSTREQFALDEDGEVLPDTKVGILEEFAAAHDGWDATAASFYVITSSLFGGGERGEQLLTELAGRGYEIGNHTHTHANLSNLGDAEVQRELAATSGMVEQLTGQATQTLSLPFGIRPQQPELAGEGEADGVSYAHEAVLLVGSGPAVSPFHADWDPLGVPRIRSSPSWDGGEPDYGSAFWLEVLEEHPERKYVSDGDPDTISFPAEFEDDLDPAHADRANPY
ncbi:polysaccharide deacetylase family protein [Egicoccus sp. AB-alg2]|uniref:polysaccharide deacetylase family protein n=1 Tax=Egicoccus sp. AB-alg2 TaxID=3242693 RepID=UPI00359E9510